jgi:hypothetical protein
VITSSSEDNFGAKFDLDADALRVHADTRFFQDWNRDNPALRVRQGDCIVEANGRKGFAMLDAIKSSGKLELVVRRSKAAATLPSSSPATPRGSSKGTSIN